ncbi:MAG TPA: hypothetical protein ENJ41_05705 [Oceanospirillales bacterium]|nr:hypothetical protein [Oceanospirillales bacterium]
MSNIYINDRILSTNPDNIDQTNDGKENPFKELQCQENLSNKSRDNCTNIADYRSATNIDYCTNTASSAVFF